MSAQAVEAIVRRATADPIFRREFTETPDLALHGYDLSIPERAALIAGDLVKLEQLGVPAEISALAAELNRSGSHTPS